MNVFCFEHGLVFMDKFGEIKGHYHKSNDPYYDQDTEFHILHDEDYAMFAPPPSLFEELDGMESEQWAQWCRENDPELQEEIL